MGPSSNNRTLLNRGRKAGLTTRELYSAMSTRPVEVQEQFSGQSDCNGYVLRVNEQGRGVFLPLSQHDKPQSD